MDRFLILRKPAVKTLPVVAMLALALASPLCGAAKKKNAPAAAPAAETGPRKFPFDPKTLVWPSPPNIARIHWLNYFAGAKIDYTPVAETKPKASWMDRLAGGVPQTDKVNKNFPFQMIGPYGIAIDSKGLVYVADQRVGA